VPRAFIQLWSLCHSQVLFNPFSLQLSRFYVGSITFFQVALISSRVDFLHSVYSMNQPISVIAQIITPAFHVLIIITAYIKDWLLMNSGRTLYCALQLWNNIFRTISYANYTWTASETRSVQTTSAIDSVTYALVVQKTLYAARNCYDSIVVFSMGPHSRFRIGSGLEI
jgi:hypothetical protein